MQSRSASLQARVLNAIDVARLCYSRAVAGSNISPLEHEALDHLHMIHVQ